MKDLSRGVEAVLDDHSNCMDCSVNSSNDGCSDNKLKSTSKSIYTSSKSSLLVLPAKTAQLLESPVVNSVNEPFQEIESLLESEIIKTRPRSILKPIVEDFVDTPASGIYADWRWRHITLTNNSTQSNAKASTAISLALNLSGNRFLNKDNGMTSFSDKQFSDDFDKAKPTMSPPQVKTPPPAYNFSSISPSEYDIKGPEIRLLPSQIQRTLLLNDSNHFKHKFVDERCNTSFFCTTFFPKQFFALRQSCMPGGEVEYIESLARCMKFDACGGKSGSGFSKTQDDRFILKYVHRVELKFILENAMQYFDYMSRSSFHNLPSV